MKKNGTFPLIVFLAIFGFTLNCAEARQGTGIDDPTQVKLTLECSLQKANNQCQQDSSILVSSLPKSRETSSIPKVGSHYESPKSETNDPASNNVAQKERSKHDMTRSNIGKEAMLIFLQKLQKVFYYSTGLVTGS